MNILKAYTSGFRKTFRLRRPVLLIYVINLLGASVVALPLYFLLDKKLGSTQIAENLLKNFESATFAEILLQLKGVVAQLTFQSGILLLIYWLISIFVAGGIIRTLSQDRFTMTSFFSGAGYNFFRFFKISAFMVGFQVVGALVIYIGALFIAKNIFPPNLPETAYYILFATVVGIHLFYFLFVFMANDFAKFYSFLYDTKWAIRSVFGGIKYAFKNFGKTTLLYLLLLILPAFVLYGYYFAQIKIGTHTALGVALVFGLQQLIIILRIWYRIWIYASPLQYFTADFLERKDVKEKIEIMNEWNKKASEQNKISINEIKNPEKETLAKVLSEKEMIEKIKLEELPEVSTDNSYNPHTQKIKKIDMDDNNNIKNIVEN